MKTENSMIFNVLIKKEEDTYIAHCMELDIVATSLTLEAVKNDMSDLIVAQVSYAFANDNLEFLYRPAPSEVWQEFYACKEQVEKRINVKGTLNGVISKFIPPWIIERTCMSSACYA